MKAIKYDSGKAPLDLVPLEGLTQVARVLAYGADKYGRDNWRKGMVWTRLCAAALRHTMEWREGLTLDPETGLNHLAHAACNFLFLLQYAKDHPKLDDRKKDKNPKKRRHK